MDPNPWAPTRAPWYRRAWAAYRGRSLRSQAVLAAVAVFLLLGLLGSLVEPPAEEVAGDAAVATSTTTTAPETTTTTERATTSTTAAPTTTTTTAPPTTTTTAPPTTTTAPPPPPTTTTTAPPPPPPPPTTTTTAAPAPACHPSYSGCLPIGTDVDCAGGEGDGPVFVEGPVYVTGYDEYDLDRDGNGVGCQS